MLKENNLKSLLYLLHEDDINELFTMIEINRELGRFDGCFELLKIIRGEKYDHVKSLFTEEVIKKNTNVFRIS